MIAACKCGSVELEVTGEPIICVACHCGDCHEGSRQIGALPGAEPVLDLYGGTQHNLFRKSRIRYLKGKEFLKSLKVESDSPNRVYASCCNSYMLLDLPGPMHWVPISRARFRGQMPPIVLRMNVKPRSEMTNTPRDVPCYRSFPIKFLGSLLKDRIAMIFNR